MTLPPDKPKEVKPPEAGKQPELGDFYDIGVFVGEGLIPPKKSGGCFYAKVYDGFLKPNGEAHFVNRSTGCNEKGLALEFLSKTLIPALQAAWDKRAKELGVTREQQRSKECTSLPAAKGSLADEVLGMLSMWQERDIYDLQVFRGRYYAATDFLEALGEKARQPDYKPNEADCVEAVNKMLATYNKNKGGAVQKLQELRYVLKRVPSFPAKLICKLYVPKPKAKVREAAKEGFPLTPAERVLVWNNLPKTDRQTRGIILVLMNSSQHGIDVANMTVPKLREACQDLAVNERCKTEVEFRMAAWAETIEWFDEMKFDIADIYAFEVVYKKKELKQPGRNRIPLDEKPKEAEKRRAAAADRAADLVKTYLVEVCGITRPGVSMHSFRYTNVSEWEAEGFARIACMACSGHATEDNYVKYAAPIYDHIKSISNTTHDFWKHAGKERLRIFTKNQLHDALVVAMKAETEKVVAEMREQHAVQSEAMRNEHAAQTTAMREAHFTQMSLMRDHYAAQMGEMRSHDAAQTAKLDQIIRLLGALLAIFLDAPSLLKRMILGLAGHSVRRFPSNGATKLLQETETLIH